MSIDTAPRRHAGFTLIELVIFIIIVSVGLAGILAVFNATVRGSADPMIRKQMLAIAEALLEEVAMNPFTYCDPDDAAAATATSTAGCTTAEGLGPEAETRGSATTPFDNVNDYYVAGGLDLDPVTVIDGGHGFAGYAATIVIDAGSVATNLTLGPAAPVDRRITSDGTAANTDLLRIAVTVTHGTDSLTVEGYRARHSPNSVP